MSNPDCKIDLTDSNPIVRTYSKVEGTAAEKLTNLITASLDPITRRTSSRKTHYLVGIPFELPIQVKLDLHWLHENGNKQLFHLIKMRLKHPVWQKALQGRNIQLLEQLKLLYELVLSKGYDEGFFIPLLESSLKEEIDTMLHIAILTYIVDRQPESLHDSTFKSNEVFEMKLSALDEEIRQFTQEISDPELAQEALSVFIPKLIANLLLTHTGEVNFGLIPLIKKHFLSAPSNYAETIGKRLDFLYREYSLRAIFPTIKATEDNGKAKVLLQILNNLPPESPVTDFQARVAVLTAFLSHIRQTSPNGCFAMTVCLAELENNPKQCLEDFQCLLSKGSLTREFNHVQREYPFLLTSESKNLTQEIDAKDSFIKLLCTSMGISDYWEKIKHIKFPINVQRLIEILAKDDKDLILRGMIAYEFQTRNGLLFLWHNCIAGMSEGKVSGLVTSEILQAILKALDADFKGLDATHFSLISKLKCSVVETILGRMSLMYDPGLEHPKLGQGGFVLYDQRDGNTNNHIRIDTPNAFREWIIQILDQVAEHPNLEDSDDQSEESNRLFQQMIKGLKKCIYSDQFMDRLLEKYMDQNIKEPSKNLDSILHTPWITRTGNSSEATLAVYLNRGGDLKSKAFKVVSAQNLLDQLHEFYHLRRQSRPVLPNLLPARVPGLHAFNLIPLSATYEGVPILKIKIMASKSYQEKMIELLKSRTQIEELDITISEQISLRQFRNALLDAWNKASLLGTENPLNRERQLDTWMIGGLSQKKKNRILGTAILIGDSNFGKGSQDLNFYCIYNPLSKKVELWRMAKDFSEVTALNPDIWVNEQTWEIFYL